MDKKSCACERAHLLRVEPLATRAHVRFTHAVYLQRFGAHMSVGARTLARARERGELFATRAQANRVRALRATKHTAGIPHGLRAEGSMGVSDRRGPVGLRSTPP